MKLCHGTASHCLSWSKFLTYFPWNTLERIRCASLREYSFENKRDELFWKQKAIVWESEDLWYCFCLVAVGVDIKQSGRYFCLQIVFILYQASISAAKQSDLTTQMLGAAHLPFQCSGTGLFYSSVNVSLSNSYLIKNKQTRSSLGDDQMQARGNYSDTWVIKWKFFPLSQEF